MVDVLGYLDQYAEARLDRGTLIHLRNFAKENINCIQRYINDLTPIVTTAKLTGSYCALTPDYQSWKKDQYKNRIALQRIETELDSRTGKD